jgi:hypothetical protein
MKNNTKNQRRHVQLMTLEQMLARWRHPVASSEALELVHWAIHMVTYTLRLAEWLEDALRS